MPSAPSVVSCAASASIIVSSGTRWQWPPVYGDFSSIAVLMSATRLSNSASSWPISSWFDSTTPASPVSASASRSSASENSAAAPCASCALTSCRTPISSSR